MYREEESIEDHTSLGYNITEYIKHDIQKFFGLNINQWLETTSYYKSVLIDKAEKAMEELQRELDKIKAENDENIKSLDEHGG